MLGKAIIINRLALVKHLHRVGVEQSKQVETLAAFSILPFHDCIEMFLKLLAEHLDIKSDGFTFLDYWKNIPSLTMKETMSSLNARRVNIKHKGILPSKSDVEISRVNTTDFLEQNILAQFEVEFKDISLLTLIHNMKVRTLLEDAQRALQKHEYEECITNTAFAFRELLEAYEKSKLGYYRDSPFFFGEKLAQNISFNLGERENRKVTQYFEKINKSIRSIREAVKILSLGIDYKRYIKFDMLTPEIREFINGEFQIVYRRGMNKWSVENCQFCIDFVMDTDFKLQEFDFDTDDIFIKDV